MTIRQREHAAELASAILRVEEQALRHSVIVCHDRDLSTLRRYLALCLRDFGPDSSATAKAHRLLAEAEEIAELERMAGL
jgi:hypothetical protein